MRWSPPRSLAVSLAGLVLAASPGTAPRPAHGQGPPRPVAPVAELEKRLEALDVAIKAHLDAGRIAEAIPPAAEELELLERALGREHWRTGDARRDLETDRRLASRPRPDQDRYARARQADAKARQLQARGQNADAAPLFQEARTIRREILGEDHPETAQSDSGLASILLNRRKVAEAEAIFRHTLAIRLAALGERHPDTGEGYNELGLVLFVRGKTAEAEAMYRKALAIDLETLGEIHPNTAGAYNNLTGVLRDQGKYAEAEAILRRVLAIDLETQGEGHPDTAISYSNLASTLRDQGKFAEAEALHRRALAIFIKVRGAGHSNVATLNNNPGRTLVAQGKYAEAEAILRQTLAIRLKTLGEGHTNTANSYNNLASALRDQGKYAEAEALHRRALAIWLQIHGEGHPNVAVLYNNLAETLVAGGRATEAEAMHRRALAILLRFVGEGYPDIAEGYKSLALALDRQGKHDEALRTWASAAASYEQSRLRGPRGLDAALTAGKSPLAAFALALARAGRPRDAWTRWEQGLARGLIDEVTGRATRPLTAAEHDREALLLGQAQALDERIGKLLALESPSQEQEKLLGDLNRQASEFRRQLLELEQQFEGRYGALAGRPAALEAIQKALPEGTALVGWIDKAPEHWACLVRHSGDPAWVRLPGSGKDGAWTPEDEGRARRLRAELDPQTTGGHARPEAEALARQRLGPLVGYLKGVNRLIVVNSPGMMGVPIEVPIAARPDPAWDGIAVAYAPSASMFAHLAGRPSARGRAPTLLALADPAYPEAKQEIPAPPPPEAGLAVARVVPNGNADLNGIRPGDVLLAYAGTTLKASGDLMPVADAGPRKVPVRYWREGVTRDVEVAAGPLGVAIDSRPAREAIQARRAAERVLLGMRGGKPARLPGTRREVEAVARLFPTGAVTTLTGERACESAVQGLARSGRMKGFRYLHFAAHGEADPLRAYRSALILAPDPDRSDDPLATEGDGTITAEQIARTWDLDADLVVLSACQTGLGRATEGEGYLGFAQPLLARGARSLVLSLWEVDDDATALLMARFYQDLLGARPGLASPLGKAEALSEAKAWLRGAGPDEVGAALAALPRGTIVRRRTVGSRSTARPYEDPTYWTAFTLIGSPD